MSIMVLSLGGALGAITRYVVGLKIMQRYPNPPFPIAMLLVNITGSLGLGLFFSVIYHGLPVNAYHDMLYLFLGMGFFGAFTTFSTFSLETVELFRLKSYKRTIVYVCVSIIGSILCFYAGFYLGINLGFISLG